MEYTITPRVPGVRPADPPDYDGITFVYITTTVITPWTVPAALQSVTLVVSNSQGFIAGMSIMVEGAGYYQVVAATALNRLTIQNPGYPQNQPPGSGILPGLITTTSLPGPMGPTGSQGNTGIQGPIGPQGNPGPPLNAKGTIATVGALPPSGNTAGDMYVVTANGHAYGWSGAAWIDLGPFQGPVGATGSTGAQGAQGPQGNTGTSGAAATIAVGTTSTLTPGSSATVSNSGSSSAAVFNFGVPAGVAGTQGATGSQGPQGNPGATGSQGPLGTPAYTNTTASFTVPGVGLTVNASVGDSSWMAVGETLYVANSGGAGVAGTLQVVSTSAGSVTLKNASSTSGAVGGTVVASPALVTPGGVPGPQGPQGPTGSGTGDMLKSVYDTNTDNIVDVAAAVPWTGITGKPATFPPDATAELVARKGVANGYPSLDATGHIPVGQLTTHASTHRSGGTDVIPVATTSNTGLVPVRSGTATTYLDGTGAWSVPPGAGPSADTMLKSVYDTNADNIVDHAALADTVNTLPHHASTHDGSGADPIATANPSYAGLCPAMTGNATDYLCGAGFFRQPTNVAPATHASTHVTGGSDVIPAPTTSASGLVPPIPNNTTTFLRGDGTFAAPVAAGGGTKTYSRFKAGDGNPPASNYAVFAVRNNTPILAFNDTTQYSIYFLDVMPEGASLASGLIIRISWVPASAASGVCIWGAQIERMNTSIDTDSFDTAGTVSLTPTSSTIPTLSSITLTTIDGVTAGDSYRLKIYRDAASGSDTMTGDAQLIAVEVRSAA